MLTLQSCRSAATVASLVLSVGVVTLAQDVIQVESGSGTRRATGTISEYTGEMLVLDHSSGREEKIPSDRVVSIEGDWTASHKAANALFSEDKYQEAADKYREALREEERRWAQRRVLAQLAWCYRYLGDTENAAKAFLPLYRDDPKTPYFPAIPLSWTAGQPEQDLERRAMAWMQDKESSAARLIGASWLLSSSRRAEAIKVLREFVNDPDPRIVFLAEAQLWRTQVVTSTTADITRWRDRIEKMPKPIRGGPYYILGLAQSRQLAHDAAALSFMKAAILYTEQRDLVPASLLAAGRELETMKAESEAANLYREILTKFAGDGVASEAASRLQDLVNRE